MNKYFLLMFLAMGIVFSYGCSKEAPSAKEDTGPVTAEKASQDIGLAICKRVIDCNPGTPVKAEDCAKQTASALSSLITNKKIELSAKQFRTCLESIEKGECNDVIRADGPPKGCEMLQ